MPLSGMLHGVVLVRTNALEERIASIIRAIYALNFSETSVRITATQLNILQDGILHSHRRENLKSYIALTRLISVAM
jgi:hypothetical protein